LVLGGYTPPHPPPARAGAGCTLNEILFLTSYAPYLHHLATYETDENQSNFEIFSLAMLSNLISIYLEMYQIIFDELVLFLNKISSNLKILSITCSNDIKFLDACQWEKLILHSFSRLEKFYLTYYDRKNNHNEYPIYYGELNQFSSSFWIERKWVIEARFEGVYIKYLIYPYRYIDQYLL